MPITAPVVALPVNGSAPNQYATKAGHDSTINAALADLAAQTNAELGILASGKADKSSLGSAAGRNTTDFASAAQGGRADTAVQPAALAGVDSRVGDLEGAVSPGGPDTAVVRFTDADDKLLMTIKSNGVPDFEVDEPLRAKTSRTQKSEITGVAYAVTDADDTHLVLGDDGWLYCIYRGVGFTPIGAETPGVNNYYQRSRDGVSWSGRTFFGTSGGTVSPVVMPSPRGGFDYFEVALSGSSATTKPFRVATSVVA